jgi:hypothetical protein
VSPERRRQAVAGAREKYKLSERRACRLAIQPRGTQRYATIACADKDALTPAIIGLASEYGALTIGGSRGCSRMLDGPLALA